MVYEKTQAMSEFDANKWFCLDEGDEHGVFKREKEGDHHASIDALPHREVSNHKYRCQKWLEGHKIDIPEGWKEKGAKEKKEKKAKKEGKKVVDSDESD